MMHCGFAMRSMLLLCVCQAGAGCNGKRNADLAPQPEVVTLAEATQLSPPLDTSQIPLKLVDVAEEAGISYRWSPPEPPPYSPLSSVGYGAAFLDFDADGWEDILLVGPQPALFRNLHNGRFARISAGLNDLPKLNYLGIGVGDYDRDGFPDVFLSGYRGGVLLHNEHGKRLRDVTREAGIDVHGGWTSAVTFADLDRDGWPDLIVGHYLRFDPNRRRMCQRNGLSFDCGPGAYAGDQPQVFRNVRGHFQDLTKAWGFDASSGKNLGVTAVDLDGDGQVEVVFTNDLAPGNLFVRHGDRFEDQGIASGTAFNRQGLLRFGMGVTVADFDGDGKLDMAMTDFEYRGVSLFRNLGNLVFKDVSGERGVKAATYPWVGFGILFADLNNDGWLDLLVANGHILSNSEEVFGTPYREPLQLLYNKQGQFSSMPDTLQGKAALRIVGRGMCMADYDHDGRLDILVVNDEGAPLLLHNESMSGNHYLSVRLRDRQGPTYGEGQGATIFAEIAGKTHVVPCPAGGSYSSVSDSRIHVGLGLATEVSALTVQWPSGRRERFGPYSADGRIEIREGTGQEVVRP